METTAQPATPVESAPTAPASPVERRLAELKGLAERDPAAAAEFAWGWFGALGAESRAQRGRAARLNELFRLGTPPEGLDGPTEGMFVTPLIAPPVDAGFRAVTAVWMPWLGKSFDAVASRGQNRLLSSARWPSKLLWPLYSMRAGAGEVLAFDFETDVVAGKDDPDRQVLKIDYSAVDENPGLIIKQIRDELVEIVPGAYLGKILWRSGGEGRGGERYSVIGYFALRQPVG